MKNTFRVITAALLILCMMFTMSSMMIFAEEGVAEDDAASDSPFEMTTIVFATKTLEHGSKITSSSVELREVPAYNAPTNAITSLEEVVGKYAYGTTYEGDYFYKGKFSNTKQVENNSHLLLQAVGLCHAKYLNIGDYIRPNTGEDVTKIIQDLIDKNPQRTIYFPDGEYIISRPICTPGDPSISVSLWLSDGAVIKASNSWSTTSTNTAMISIGGKNQLNTHMPIGSYYSLQGGTIDGGTRCARGVSIDSGRETLVKNVRIINSELGLEIKKHPNYGSTDADIEDITIVGSGKAGSIGFKVVGFDCTATNIKVYNCAKGAHIDGGGTLMKNIQIYSDTGRTNDIGIYEGENAGNWYYNCSVENYGTAFKLKGHLSTVDRCYAKWTTADCRKQVMFDISDTNMALVLGNCKAEFYDNTTQNAFLLGGSSGNGGVEAPIYNPSKITHSADNTSKRLISGSAIIPIQ